MSHVAGRLAGRKHTAVAFAVSAIILAILVYKIDVRLHASGGQSTSVADQFRRVSWPVLLGTFAYSALWHIIVGADKWWRILRAMGARVPWAEVCRVRLGSDPIRFASPMKLGEIVNAAYFARLEAFGFSRAAGSVVFDKAVNFFGTLVWLYVGMVAMLKVPPAGHLVLHSAMGAGIVVVLLLPSIRGWFRSVAIRINPRVGRLTAGLLAAFEEFTSMQKLGFLAYGVIFQLRPLVVCYLLFAAFRPERMPSAAEFLTFGSVAVLMSNVPLTLGGIGPREAAILALFAPYGQPITLLSVGVLMSFSIQIVPAIVGIPFVFGLLRSLTVVPSEPAAAPAVLVSATAAGPVEAKE